MVERNASGRPDDEPPVGAGPPTGLAQPRAFSEPTSLGDVRVQMSRLQGLFVLGQLMAVNGDEDQLLRLACSSVPAVGAFRLLGVHLGAGGWYAPPGVPRPSRQLRDQIEAQISQGNEPDGAIALRGHAWAWAYPLRSLEGTVGHLVVAAESEPTSWEYFLLGMLAQQTAVAVTNARVLTRERAQAGELQQLNAALSATVAALEQSTAIHTRLTEVAAAGAGEEGLAQALHDLTGWPVAIEDRSGNLRAWSGPHRPEPYPSSDQASREKLLDRVRQAARPVYEGDRLLALASSRADTLGVIALVGVPPDQAEPARTALEHAATVLAVELARLRSIAETELRLGRDLVEELIANTDERAAVSRARAMGYDLRRTHRVAVVTTGRRTRRDPESTFNSVRRAVRDVGLGTLTMPRGDTVIVLTYDDRAWAALDRRLLSELGPAASVGVGSPCQRLDEFPRSYREATLALRIRNPDGGGRRIIFYEEMGAFRLLAEVGELSAIDAFVDDWIGALVAYDRDHNASLVETLSAYLECRGNYDATAATLSVHRSTLKYRLGRIREVSGHDLKDPDGLFNLQLATRAWSTRRAIDRSGSAPSINPSTQQPTGS